MTKWQSNTQQTSTLHFLENIGKKTLVSGRLWYPLWGVGVTVVRGTYDAGVYDFELWMGFVFGGLMSSQYGYLLSW